MKLVDFSYLLNLLQLLQIFYPPLVVRSFVGSFGLCSRRCMKYDIATYFLYILSKCILRICAILFVEKQIKKKKKKFGDESDIGCMKMCESFLFRFCQILYSVHIIMNMQVLSYQNRINRFVIVDLTLVAISLMLNVVLPLLFNVPN